ncbi:ABC transporter ATP-binding protein [Sandarakinorhabdus limnophila]|uniref:ABC transporter ATP-binding protein n=1 Tax=Sandarakinorhabdus limnophila TaxID=210512 RepID=UPI0026EBB747|nr:ABC transporter ATP-binding protein [Sandarakinorhabdus limnophila]
MSGTAGISHVPRRTTTLSWQQTLAAFARYWLTERGRIAAIIALLLLVVAAETATPLALGQLAGAVAQIGPGVATAIILQSLLAVASAMAAAILLRQWLDRLWNGLTTRAMQRLQLDLFARVQRLPADWHANSFAGATVHRISRARWALDMLSNIIVLRLFQPVLTLLIVGAILCWRYPLAGLTFTAGATVYFLASWMLATRWVRPISVSAATRDSQLTGALADAVAGNSTVKAFGAEPREDERLRGISDHWAQVAVVSFDRATDTNAVQQLLWMATQLGVLALVALQAMQGQAGVADIAFVMSAIALLSGSLRNLGQDIRTTQRAYAELEDAAEFLIASHRAEHAQRRLPAGAVAGRIEFDHVSFSYPSGRQVFDCLSFVVPAGSHVALVGPSGSGKSTVTKLVQRLYEIDSGCISIDGHDISDLAIAELRSMIAIVPQDPILFHRSLADNIRYGRPDATNAQVRDAARRARADLFIEILPNGYDTVVGERGAKLSGGERQRVAIARALLADRPILLLDEATSSLDNETEVLVQQALAELVTGRTTITIAHRLSTIRDADLILVFGEGGIVETGTHSSLISQSAGQYRRLVELGMETQLAV